MYKRCACIYVLCLLFAGFVTMLTMGTLWGYGRGLCTIVYVPGQTNTLPVVDIKAILPFDNSVPRTSPCYAAATAMTHIPVALQLVHKQNPGNNFLIWELDWAQDGANPDNQKGCVDGDPKPVGGSGSDNYGGGGDLGVGDSTTLIINIDDSSDPYTNNGGYYLYVAQQFVCYYSDAGAGLFNKTCHVQQSPPGIIRPKIALAVVGWIFAPITLALMIWWCCWIACDFDDDLTARRRANRSTNYQLDSTFVWEWWLEAVCCCGAVEGCFSLLRRSWQRVCQCGRPKCPSCDCCRPCCSIRRGCTRHRRTQTPTIVETEAGATAAEVRETPSYNAAAAVQPPTYDSAWRREGATTAENGSDSSA